MDADGSLWLPCCNFIMYLQCISVGLSIKAVHLDKEVRFLLSDHLDLIREHLSLTWHDLFWVLVLQQNTLVCCGWGSFSCLCILFCFVIFVFFTHGGHYLFYRQGRLRAQKQMHRQKQFFGVLSGWGWKMGWMLSTWVAKQHLQSGSPENWIFLSSLSAELWQKGWFLDLCVQLQFYEKRRKQK